MVVDSTGAPVCPVLDDIQPRGEVIGLDSAKIMAHLALRFIAVLKIWDKAQVDGNEVKPFNLLLYWDKRSMNN